MFRLKLNTIFLWAVLACSLLSLIPRGAVAANWYDLPYDHFSKDEPVVDLLMDFSSAIGIPIIVSDRLKSSSATMVNGHFRNVTAEMFLLKLSNLYQIIWYYDGHLLFIYHADEIKSELLHFSDAKAHGVKNTLKRLGVWDPRFNWREMREKNLLFISGPPRYIELVKEISKVIDVGLKKEKDTTYEVRVFPLNYAWADDRTISHRGGTMKISGVATTINRILGDRTAKKRARKKSRKSKGLVNSKGLKGTGLSASNQDHESVNEENLHTPGDDSYIEANSQQNAVIVYDLASRMPMYEKLIKSLDVKSEQIEIEVSIIDISTERLLEIGVDWQASDGHNRYGFGDAANIRNPSTEGLSSTFGVDKGKSISSILSGNADYFLGKVRLLANDGEGQVLSQPSVMTMNNIEAIIDHSTTFYVKLEGDEEVDLVPISAGSVLKVTPRLINQPEERKIHLDVAIEDGRVANPLDDDITSVDGVPSVVVSTINTQAVIGQESSLLVGGYYYDANDSKESKVPLLGDIPLVKTLFSNQRKQRVKMARLFLITPRVVDEVVAKEKGDHIRKVIDEERNFDVLGYKKPRYEVINYSNPTGLNIFD